MYEEITTLITSVGFPIAAAVAMFYLVFHLITEMKAMVEKNNETNKEISATLKEVMGQVTDMRIQLERLELKVDHNSQEVKDADRD